MIDEKLKKIGTYIFIFLFRLSFGFLTVNHVLVVLRLEVFSFQNYGKSKIKIPCKKTAQSLLFFSAMQHTYIHEILIFIGLFIFQATPHGSLENVSVVSPTQDRLSLEAMVAKASNVASNLISFEKQPQNLRRSTSMSTPQHHPTPPNVSDTPPPPQQVSITGFGLGSSN